MAQINHVACAKWHAPTGGLTPVKNEASTSEELMSSLFG